MDEWIAGLIVILLMLPVVLKALEFFYREWWDEALRNWFERNYPGG